MFVGWVHLALGFIRLRAKVNQQALVIGLAAGSIKGDRFRPVGGGPLTRERLMTTQTIPRSAADRPAVPAAPTDGELLDRYARGRDQRAFEALVRRHGPRVFGVCRRVLRDPHAAEDAFQATFLVLARKAGGIARPDALAGWLHGVAVRVARKARRNPPRPLPAGGPAAAEPARDPDHWELVRVLDEELDRLPPDDRDLIVLIYFEGRTHAEAARAVGCPAGSVAWRLARARAVLRARLVRRGIALAVGVVLLLAGVGAAQAVPEPAVRRAVAAGDARDRRRRRFVPDPLRPADGPPADRRRNRFPAPVLVLMLSLLLGGGLYAALGDRPRAGDRPPVGPSAATPAEPSPPPEVRAAGPEPAPSCH
jgi:RNA polymerase sigma factor (sigma-70 family)